MDKGHEVLRGFLPAAVLLVAIVAVLNMLDDTTDFADRGATPSQTAPQGPLDQMVVAFLGSYSRDQIKSRLDEAMRLYQTPISDENYSRAGSVLVTMRRDLGPREMDILDYMIRSYVPGVSMSFPEMAAISATALATGR